MNTPKKQPTKLRGRDGRLINIGKWVLMEQTTTLMFGIPADTKKELVVGKLVKVYSGGTWLGQALPEPTGGRVQLTDDTWKQALGKTMVQLPDQLVKATQEELALFWALQTSGV